MKITAVQKSRKYRNMLSVYIDGKFGFNISEKNFVSLNMAEDAEIAEETVDYVKNTLNFIEAKSRAVAFLSARLHTEKEVREKLHETGYGSDCANRVIDELKAIGYINDRLYAQKYVFDRSKLKPMSKKLMKRELLMKGIPEEIADEVLQNWKVEDLAVARNLLKRKFGKYDMNDEKIRKKARMFLLYRGFSTGTAMEALRGLSADAGRSHDR